MIPEGSYPVPTNPAWEIIDPSKMEDYLRCPRKFFYRHILGWESSSKLHNDKEFGSAWHEALGHLLEHGYSKEQVSLAFEKFYNYYRQHLDETTDEMFSPKNPELALMALNRYAKKFENDHSNYEILFVEISGTCSIDADLFLHWRMDSIVRDRSNKKVLTIEHKTSKRLSRQWRDQWLLHRGILTYIHNLYSMFPHDEVKGALVRGTFFYKTKTEFEEIPVSKDIDSMKNWLYNIRFWVDQLLTDFEELQKCTEDNTILQCFPMNDTSCTDFWGCPYHDFCHSWPNPLKNCEEPPLGFHVRFWDPREEDKNKDPQKVFDI